MNVGAPYLINMNTKLLASKKFRAAVISAIASLLTFCVTKFGLNLNVDEIINLMTLVLAPFLIYIGAEGYSERDAKVSALEAKNKTEISDKLIEKLTADIQEPPKE